MNKLTLFNEAQQPFEKHLLNELEVKIGQELPPVLRNLLLLYNGGYPNLNTFLDKEFNYPIEVVEFLSIQNIYMVYNSFYDTLQEATIVPFAAGYDMNYYCIWLQPTQEIWVIEIFWGEDGIPVPTEIAAIKKEYIISLDLDIFLSSLYYTEENDMRI